MVDYIKREPHSLSDLVKDAIVKMITSESFPNNKLPAESKLAERFGCSVAVVREALLLLSKDGVVTKRQGSGNYFHLSALNSGARIDRFPGFRKMLQDQGYKVDAHSYNFRCEVPDEKIRKVLNMQAGEKVISYERLLYADSHPAILCFNCIPEKLFRKQIAENAADLSLFDVFRDYLQLEMAYGHMEFHPRQVTAEETEKLNMKEGTPVILMNEQYYSIEDILMGYSEVMWNDEYITLSILSR